MTIPRPSLRIATVASIYGVVLIFCALFAYWDIFSQWRPWDDTGYVTYSIQLFIGGQALYGHVFSPYGPFVYELWRGVFGAFGDLGHPLTTDSAYFATWLIWLGTSVLVGLIAQRLSTRLSVGVIAQVLSFLLLGVSTNEPILPDLLVTSMLVLLVAICVFGLRRQPEISLTAIGALVGMLLLSKINSGTFAFVAVAYAAVMSLPRLRQRALLRRCATATVILIGPALMFPDLSRDGTAKYALLTAAAGCALALVTRPLPAGQVELHEDEWWIPCLLRGLSLSVIAIVGLIVVLGTSPEALFETLIVDGSRQRVEDPSLISLSGMVVWWALAAIGAAYAVSRAAAARVQARGPSKIAAFGRVLCGLAIWFSLLSASPFDISPQDLLTLQFALALPLAWVAAVPSSRDDGTTASRFTRLLIPALAIVNSLFAYPVAGSQVDFAAVMFVLCGAVCVADGLSDLEVCAARGELGQISAPRARAVMTAFTVALATIWSIQYVERPMDTYRARYDHNAPLPFPGATHLRLAPPITGAFATLIAAARTHCKTLISLPGLPSLNLWSELSSPGGLADIGVWWKVLLPNQLSTAYSQARRAPGLCEVRNNREIEFWAGVGPLPRIPLILFLENDFTPIATFGESTGDPHFVYQLLQRRDS